MAGPREVVNYVKHKARPFIFTAALPAMQMAAALKALDIMETEPQHRDQLWRNVRHYHRGMNALGFDTLGTQTPIVPVVIGDDDMTLLFWRELWEEGIFTHAVGAARGAAGTKHHSHLGQRQPRTPAHRRHFERVREGREASGRHRLARLFLCSPSVPSRPKPT